jgi:hypothetical protein
MIKIGSEVLLKSTSEFNMGEDDNPLDTYGVVSNIDNTNFLPISVQWENGEFNTYTTNDLVEVIDRETPCNKLRNKLQPLFALSSMLIDAKNKLNDPEIMKLIMKEAQQAEDSKDMILNLLTIIDTQNL